MSSIKNTQSLAPFREDELDIMLDVVSALRESFSLPLSVTDRMVIDLQNAISARIHASILHTIAVNALRRQPWQDELETPRSTIDLERLAMERSAESLTAKAEYEECKAAVAFACTTGSVSEDLVRELVKRTHDRILIWYKYEGYDTTGYSNPFIRPRRSFGRRPLAPLNTSIQLVSESAGPAPWYFYLGGGSIPGPSRCW